MSTKQLHFISTIFKQNEMEMRTAWLILAIKISANYITKQNFIVYYSNRIEYKFIVCSTYSGTSKQF